MTAIGRLKWRRSDGRDSCKWGVKSTADGVALLKGRLAARDALMEVKLGASFVDKGCASLRKLADRLDAAVMGAPAFSAVIVPGGYAYRRDDGVYVIPIARLAP